MDQNITVFNYEVFAKLAADNVQSSVVQGPRALREMIAYVNNQVSSAVISALIDHDQLVTTIQGLPELDQAQIDRIL